MNATVLRRYGRLFVLLCDVSVHRLAVYRLDFAVGIASFVVRIATQLALLNVVFGHVSTLGGWSYHQVLFLLGFLGLGISMYPYVVPRAVTIWDAAAPPESQLFMLVGALVIIPLILAYTGWAYWVFRGKAGLHGYH